MDIISKILKIIDWSRIKVRIQLSNNTLFPYRKEIWWANLGENIGVEMNGKNDQFERPVLVIYVFNIHSLLIAPITSNTEDRRYNVIFTNLDGELNSINISQLRTISTKRLFRKVTILEDHIFENVITLISETIIKTKTPFGVISESSQGGPSKDILS